MKHIKKVLIVILITIELLVGILVNVGSANADGGGEAVEGGGLRPGGGGSDTCYDGGRWTNLWMVDCSKKSWVFFKVNETEAKRLDNLGLDKTITFTYTSAEAEPTDVPGTCADHADGGFWHYGNNLLGAGFTTTNSANAGDINVTSGGRAQNIWGHWSTLKFAEDGFSKLYRTIDLERPNQVVGQLKYGGGWSPLYKATDKDIDGESMRGTEANVLRDWIRTWNNIHPDQLIDENDTKTARETLADGNFGLFCYWAGLKKGYKAQSNVSVSGSASGLATTEITTKETKDADATPEVNLGDEVEIVFSHNPYITGEEDEAKWTVKRSWWNSTYADWSAAGFFNGSGTSDLLTTWRTENAGDATSTEEDDLRPAELSGVIHANRWESANVSGQTSLKIGRSDDPYYASDRREFVVRDAIKVQLNRKGTWKFCETFTVEGSSDSTASKAETTVCAVIKVKDDGDPEPEPEPEPEDPELMECTDEDLGWTPSSYTNSWTLSDDKIVATTSVLSKIQNESLTARGRSGGAYINWLGKLGETGNSWQTTMAQSGTTYAKPGDKIKWVNCYYPGAQAVADKSIVTGDDTDSGSSNTLTTGLVKNQTWTASDGTTVGWTNQYAVQSETGSVNGVFKANRLASPVGAPNTVLPPDGANISSSGSNPFTFNVGLALGDTKIRQSGNTYTILNVNDAGKTYSEKASTDGMPYVATVSYAYHSWSCGTVLVPATCSHNNSFGDSYNYASWDKTTGTLTSGTQVIVPYNFINSASFDIAATAENVVYPGDKITVQNAKVEIGERYNDVTEASYTTQVDNAEVRLVAYISDKSEQEQINYNNGRSDHESGDGEINPQDDTAASTNICEKGWLWGQKQCMEVNEFENINSAYGTTTLNLEGSTTGYTHSTDLKFDNSYNVFDASAGDYMCFVITVYPWRSAPQANNLDNDTTTDSHGTEHKWLITAPKCKQIAKKPTVQVLGSSIYTKGGITTSVSRKQSLYNSGIYYLPTNNSVLYFGSFGELGVTANGRVSGFASGAALGRTTEDAKNVAKYGFSSNSSSGDEFCRSWTPLTFANYSKASGTVAMLCGNGGTSAGLADITDASIIDREALVDYFVPSGTEPDAVGSYDLTGNIGTQVANGAGKNIRYVSTNGDTTVTGGSLGAYQTRIVKADGNVTISGNIYYTGNYTTSAEVPKAIIYATGDIEINCDVRQIDAILIAGGTVYTCGSYTVDNTSTMENKDRSQSQLVINGAILADKVELARTYGSAVGEKSGVAAEVINYDTSVLVWGRSAAGANDSNAMSTVYLHELAPRY